MHNVLFELGTRRFAGLWLILITGLAAALIWFVFHYRGEGRWWVRTDVALFVFVASPAGVVLLSDLLGTESIIPGPLVWLAGLAAGELVVMCRYPLAAFSLLLGVAVVAKRGVSPKAKMIAATATLASCLLVALYWYIASRPVHW